mgnify:CR=1 FL=1
MSLNTLYEKFFCYFLINKLLTKIKNVWQLKYLLIKWIEHYYNNLNDSKNVSLIEFRMFHIKNQTVFWIKQTELSIRFIFFYKIKMLNMEKSECKKVMGWFCFIFVISANV